MKKITLVIFLNFLIFNSGFGQGVIQWQNTIGGIDADKLTSIEQTFDGGYICGGYSKSNISGDKTENCLGFYDYWIIKLDSLGAIQWQNTIAGNFDDQLNSIKQTSDYGYICGGQSTSDISGDKTENSIGTNNQIDYWVLKLDALGNIQWQNTIGGDGNDILFEVQETFDGGYICGGFSSSLVSGDKTDNGNGGSDYWIIKLNASGAILWQNTIGGSNSDRLYTLHQTIDKGFILAGTSTSNISGDKTENCWGMEDFWVVKTDSLGNVQWDNTIGGSQQEYFADIVQTGDAGFFCGGASRSYISGDKTEPSNGNEDYWVLKLDSMGVIQWQNTIGGNDADEAYSVNTTADTGYIVGGRSFSGISGDKTENTLGYWVLKLDSAGNIQWQNSIGGGNDWLTSLQQTSDFGYILGGYSNSNISADKTENNWDTTLVTSDYWIIKLYPDSVTGIKEYGFDNTALKVYPNPAKNNLTVSGYLLSDGKAEIKVFDLYGRIIFATQTTTDNYQLTTANFTKGIYFVQAGALRGKFVKE